MPLINTILEHIIKNEHDLKNKLSSLEIRLQVKIKFTLSFLYIYLLFSVYIFQDGSS